MIKYIIIFVIITIIFFKSKFKVTFRENNFTLITRNKINYVHQVKQQLLYHIDKLLTDNNIRYTIAHGNLLEYVRNEKILHDDDIDIRFDMIDTVKWENIFNDEIILAKYNLMAIPNHDTLFLRKDQMSYKLKLIHFHNLQNIKEFEHMKIQADIVPNIFEKNKEEWPDYDIDYNRIKKITYNGISTYVPQQTDIEKVLQQYGKFYMVPHKKSIVFF